MITRVKISAVRASGVRRLFEGSAYSIKNGKHATFFEPWTETGSELMSSSTCLHTTTFMFLGIF